MAGTYYNIGVVTPIANIAAALTAKYGAWADPANLNGYREYDNSAEYLLFSCAAIAGNRFIRLRWTSTTLQHQWGTARAGANTLTSPLDFGGTYAVTSAFTHIQLILHDDTYFMCSTGSDARDNARSIIIGKLSNSEFGVYGSSFDSSFPLNCNSYNITTEVRCLPSNLLLFNMQNAANEIYKQNITLMTYADFQPLLNGAALVWFNNVFNIGHNSNVKAYILGANFLIGQGRQVITTTISNYTLACYSALYCAYTP